MFCKTNFHDTVMCSIRLCNIHDVVMCSIRLLTIVFDADVYTGASWQKSRRCWASAESIWRLDHQLFSDMWPEEKCQYGEIIFIYIYNLKKGFLLLLTPKTSEIIGPKFDHSFKAVISTRFISNWILMSWWLHRVCTGRAECQGDVTALRVYSKVV